jgi:hypothetical protein
MKAKERIDAILKGNDKLSPLTCIICHADANTLNDIQDLIEDSGLPIQDVLDAVNKEWNKHNKGTYTTRKYFVLERGRLRLNVDPSQHITVKNFVETLEKMLK